MSEQVFLRIVEGRRGRPIAYLQGKAVVFDGQSKSLVPLLGEFVPIVILQNHHNVLIERWTGKLLSTRAQQLLQYQEEEERDQHIEKKEQKHHRKKKRRKEVVNPYNKIPIQRSRVRFIS
ncbi:MAG: hypothetical protein A3D35_03040 [Candidatus Staskawiczbacteria bacterium RIFCSPHIGHO2_02_FULL_34_9]|uniref:Uncharacterized protein n=1 Tax=Candidatus Staskawiczbacteria bacterium RIFCSPHIGHO2_02_FULL_34_9 TaxID=1802206 RepID=A0A1G2I2G7_9BACT|nr:MAG: hypothetical protein A3D35_03040 [Candidatus Staskawiczbacteria bacterium RIFCSPHIGHO2_02_FULL_34_9]